MCPIIIAINNLQAVPFYYYTDIEIKGKIPLRVECFYKLFVELERNVYYDLYNHLKLKKNLYINY